MVSNITDLSAKTLASRAILSGMMTIATVSAWWKDHQFNNWDKYMEDWAKISTYTTPPDLFSVKPPDGVEYKW